jgi:hypothetical protein
MDKALAVDGTRGKTVFDTELRYLRMVGALIVSAEFYCLQHDDKERLFMRVMERAVSRAFPKSLGVRFRIINVTLFIEMENGRLVRFE